MTAGTPRAGRWLAAAALTLAAAGALAGGGGSPPRALGVTELSAELAAGNPLIDAVTLAEWIRDRRAVRVLDVQDSSDHVRFSIPTARHAPYRELPGAKRSAAPIVLYDDGSGDAARAWLLLRRLGHADVRVLERGVVGWVEGILEPVLPAGTPQERARYDRVADVSRYFGGMPRVGTREAPRGGDAEAAGRLLSRRGCY